MKGAASSWRRMSPTTDTILCVSGVYWTKGFDASEWHRIWMRRRKEEDDTGAGGARRIRRAVIDYCGVCTFFPRVMSFHVMKVRPRPSQTTPQLLRV